MTIKVKPPVLKEDIHSSFEVEWNDGTLCIEAAHTWSVDPDISVWSDLTWSDVGDDIEFTEWGVEIRREFDYRPRPDSEYNAHVACYVSKYCDVPDMNGFNDDRAYTGDFPDPFLFEGDQEEFTVVDGVPQEKKLNSHYRNGELVTEEWYEPLFSVEDITSFAFKHHMGKLSDSPTPVQQVNEVLEWNHPEMITLEEYKDLHHNTTTEAKAD